MSESTIGRGLHGVGAHKGIVPHWPSTDKS